MFWICPFCELLYLGNESFGKFSICIQILNFATLNNLTMIVKNQMSLFVTKVLHPRFNNFTILIPPFTGLILLIVVHHIRDIGFKDSSVAFRIKTMDSIVINRTITSFKFCFSTDLRRVNKLFHCIGFTLHKRASKFALVTGEMKEMACFVYENCKSLFSSHRFIIRMFLHKFRSHSFIHKLDGLICNVWYSNSWKVDLIQIQSISEITTHTFFHRHTNRESCEPRFIVFHRIHNSCEKFTATGIRVIKRPFLEITRNVKWLFV